MTVVTLGDLASLEVELLDAQGRIVRKPARVNVAPWRWLNWRPPGEEAWAYVPNPKQVAPKPKARTA